IQDSHNPSSATRNSDNRIIGNYVGTDVTGTRIYPYTKNGIASDTTTAGVDLKDGATDIEVAYNVIGGNFGGVIIWGFERQSPQRAYVHDNLIGIGVNGERLPNDLYGVRIGDLVHDARIERNIIANNGVGVQLLSSARVHNRISQNAIYANTGLGIDLSPSGVNPNDSGDNDSGPNDLLNFPVLQQVSTAEVSGTACAGCTVEIFAADQAAGSNGSGQRFVGAGLADASGQFVALVNGVQVGEVLTATAIDKLGNTSEFARNVAAVQGSTPGVPTPTLPPALGTPTIGPVETVPPAATPIPSTPTVAPAPELNPRLYLPGVQR
ncbi:MAG: hypothetical protein M3R61_21165, partial [Chloroflexota bacterium]|nr:hypothetical protein [Chloroflexota bacterium]